MKNIRYNGGTSWAEKKPGQITQQAAIQILRMKRNSAIIRNIRKEDRMEKRWRQPEYIGQIPG